MAGIPENLAYQTYYGSMLRGTAEAVLQSSAFDFYRGRIQLIFTSPPFPLNRKKAYGNLNGDDYVKWLADFGPLFRQLLTPTGSIVIELGNSWVQGRPIMSTLAIKALLQFQEQNEFRLCQEFICHNPARLPSPAQWVTVNRMRVKDSFTRIWWMAASDEPKADNRRVLVEYSNSMKKLLRKQKYNAGERPSEHVISETSFLTNNGGAIPPNVLVIANTKSDDPYQVFCKENELAQHPARMPQDLAAFFIKFLTEPDDIVLDPFAGSNTTGSAAEKLGRGWLAIEPNEHYIRTSKARFNSFRVLPELVAAA